jgi:Replication-relaxation
MPSSSQSEPDENRSKYGRKPVKNRLILRIIMPQSTSIALSQNAAVGLFFMQRYRFLTINQYARVAHLNRSTASDQLRHMQHHGLLGSFGNTGIRGYGKTPKVYFLTRKGFDILHRECDVPAELIGTDLSLFS